LELLKKTVGVKVLFRNPAVVAVGVANPLDLVLMPASVCGTFLKNLLNFVVSIVQRLELSVAVLNGLICSTLMVNQFLLFGSSRTTT